LIKYIKSVLCRAVKHLSYIEDAWFLKVNIILTSTSIILVVSLFVCRMKSMNFQSYSMRTSVTTKPLSIYVTLYLFLVWVLQSDGLTHVNVVLLMKLRRVPISSEFKHKSVWIFLSLRYETTCSLVEVYSCFTETTCIHLLTYWVRPHVSTNLE